MPIAVSTDAAQAYSRRWAQHQQPGFRVLLALDGQDVNHDLLDRALECSVELTERLDILLVRPPKAPTFLLGGLLMRLERHGVDFRLTCAEGTLGDEVPGYLRRFHGIRTLVLERRDRLPDHTLAQLLAEDYRLITLAEREPAPLHGARAPDQGLPVGSHRRPHQASVIPPVSTAARAADASPTRMSAPSR